MGEQTAETGQSPTEVSAEAAAQALAVAEPKEEKKKVSFEEGLTLVTKYLPAKKLSPKEQAQLELAFRHNPELWRTIGDMASQTERFMIEKMVDQPAAELAIKHGVTRLRKDLGEQDAPALEKLLIDQVVLCWLNLNAVQRSYAHNMSGVITLTAGQYWEKRLTMAQARYMKAVETLARVRKLSQATPLQVNIGGQQINVAGASSAD